MDATQTDLYDEAVPHFDAMSAAARKKIGAGEAWEWCVAEVVAGGILLEGGVPNSSGRRRERWVGVSRTKVVVTDADIDAAQSDFEATTGKCAACAGSGKTLKSAAVRDGKTYREYRACSRCSGVGTAKVA